MISNPYAKKRSSADQEQGTRTSSEGTTTAGAAHQPPSRHPVSASSGYSGVASVLSRPIRPQHAAAAAAASLPLPAATTFSQAFESIEDTDVYQQQQRSSSISTRDGAGNQQERAEQRAFDTSVAGAAVAAAASDTIVTTGAAAEAQSPQMTMSDRDHHVFLQQPHVLYVSVKQRGNGVLDYIRNVPTQFQKMVPDYIFSSTSCALFLSIRYHKMHGEYIGQRIKALRTDFTLRILLVLVDDDDNQKVLMALSILAVHHSMTLILAWTEEEAARYLETFKALDGKDASSIQKNKETGNFADQVTDYLTTCKGINKTDAASVLTQFGSVRAAMAATPDELGLIGGLGEVKVKRLYDAFHKPFSSKAARLRNQKRQAQRDEEAAAQQKLLDEESGGEEQKSDGEQAGD